MEIILIKNSNSIAIRLLKVYYSNNKWKLQDKFFWLVGLLFFFKCIDVVMPGLQGMKFNTLMHSNGYKSQRWD